MMNRRPSSPSPHPPCAPQRPASTNGDVSTTPLEVTRSKVVSSSVTAPSRCSTPNKYSSAMTSLIVAPTTWMLSTTWNSRANVVRRTVRLATA